MSVQACPPPPRVRGDANSHHCFDHSKTVFEVVDPCGAKYGLLWWVKICPYVFLNFFPNFWDIIDIWHHVGLRCTIWWFDTWIYYAVVSTISLVNKSFTSRDYSFAVVVVVTRTLQVYAHRSFLACSTVVNHSRRTELQLQKLVHLPTESWCPVTNTARFSTPESLATVILTLFLWVRCFGIPHVSESRPDVFPLV